jgi:hypothetical protein
MPRPQYWHLMAMPLPGKLDKRCWAPSVANVMCRAVEGEVSSRLGRLSRAFLCGAL